MIGQKLSPVLCEIESTLWEFEEQELGNPEFTKEGFRAILKIFMCAMMDKMWVMLCWIQGTSAHKTTKDE